MVAVGKSVKKLEDKLREINDNRGFKNSRREKNERHESFNEAMNDMKKLDLGNKK